jgi:hypothetical protein
MLILQKLGGLTTPPIPPLATALGSGDGDISGDEDVNDNGSIHAGIGYCHIL